jgi:hypothetical protein
VVVHIYNPSAGKQEDHKFESSLGYIARSCLKKPEPTNQLTITKRGKRGWETVLDLKSKET